MTKVTYVPQDPSDPAVMVWNGVKFPANVPVDLDPKTHGYKVPMPKKTLDPATGRTLTEHIETWVSMIDQAKGNPSFRVEGEEAPAPRKAGRPRTPKTSDEYRSFAQAWISASDDPDEMLQRWEDEAALREKIEVGEDDKDYLRPFFEIKLHQLGAGPEKHPLKMVMAE